MLFVSQSVHAPLKAAVSRKSVIFCSHFVWEKIMAATRQGCGKRQLQGKWHLNESAWAVKLFARLTELWSSDVRDTCAISRHFLLVQKAQKNHWTSWHCPFKTCRWWSWFCFSKRKSFVKVSLSGHGPSAANEKNSVRRQFAPLPWTKTRTIIKTHGEKNAVPHVISCLIRSDQRRASPIRATVRDFCPALIAPDRAWYHTWNSVLLAANLEDGSFFVCPG